eukprot:8906245-Pyramimonas_sp.AAC.2
MTTTQLCRILSSVHSWKLTGQHVRCLQDNKLTDQNATTWVDSSSLNSAKAITNMVNESHN